MATINVTIDDDLLEVIEDLAKAREITVEEVLKDVIAGQLGRMRARMKDPMIGLFDSAEPDLSERDEEILRAEWKPD
jgi:hypothetical protein